MILFIHLQIKPLQEISFTNDWLESLKGEFPESVFFEADNHSEPFLIQQGIQFLKEAKKVVLLLECSENESPGKATALLEKVLRSKNISPLIFFQGENKLLRKMMMASKKEVTRLGNILETVAQLRSFFSQQAQLPD